MTLYDIVSLCLLRLWEKHETVFFDFMDVSEHICIIHGFPTKIESMQFELALKHIPPRNAGGIVNRIKKLKKLLHKEKWTSRAPLSETMPLTIEWVDKSYRPVDMDLPVYINETIC